MRAIHLPCCGPFRPYAHAIEMNVGRPGTQWRTVPGRIGPHDPSQVEARQYRQAGAPERRACMMQARRKDGRREINNYAAELTGILLAWASPMPSS